MLINFKKKTEKIEKYLKRHKKQTLGDKFKERNEENRIK